MSTIGPASELSAVNEMLAAIGESPIEDLDNLPPSASDALTVLRNFSRDFQEEGHWFNYETNYVLTPDAEGRITIPENVLAIDGVDLDVIERRPYLYNRETKTDLFTAPVACEVSLHLPWEQLPSVARRYIVAQATELFVDGTPGGPGITEARARNLLRAKVAFERAVIKAEDLNILSNPSIGQMTQR